MLFVFLDKILAFRTKGHCFAFFLCKGKVKLQINLCFYMLFVFLDKILTFRKLQINLCFRSLNRIFARIL